MNISQKGIDLIKKFEGCRLQSYICPGNVWTIGYGHTGGDVFAGKTINQAEADRLLREDLKRFELYVTQYVTMPLNQGQFDALVSFTYNCGVGNLKTLIANRSLPQIAEALLLYNKASGKVLEGLKKRRAEERTLFLSEGTGSATLSGIVTYSKAKSKNDLVSKNFKVGEFACKDGSDEIRIDVDFVRTKLQAVRDHFGVPLIINSAYRTAAYNKKIAGASKSYHMTGQAFDIVVKGHTPQEVARFAQQIGINGIIQYNTFVHIDSRPARYWAQDDNGTVTVKSGF
jgi:lysozyme